MRTDTAVVYTKLFRALEEGKKKEERTLLLHLRAKFGVPRLARASGWLAEHVPVEDVFVEIVNHIAPFASILSGIYRFLDQHRATIVGKADQFALRFEELHGRVPFGLDSFPKTFVEALTMGSTDAMRFNPEATGRLLVDTPDYWGECGALGNLAGHPFVYITQSLLSSAPGYPETERFVQANLGVIERAIGQIQQVMQACKGTLVESIESGHDLDCIGYGADELHFYYRSADDHAYWKQTVADYNQRKIDRFQVFERDREMDRGFRRFNLTPLHAVLSAWESYPKRVREGIRGKYGPHIPGADEWERYVGAFGDAFRLLFPYESEPVALIQRIVDSVILPYWRHRWRLYEVWALVFTMDQGPIGTRALPLLTLRDDGPDTADWPIPHGDAKHPVGEIVGARGKLEVWFQRKTRSLAGSGYIEPDIRLLSPLSPTEDVFILELKDRHNGPLSHVKEVIRKYSLGSSAKWICLANYSSFRCDEIRGKVTIWESGGKTILLADQFRPGCIYPPVVEALQQAMREALGGGSYDLLVDVSGSVQGIAIRDQLLCLASEKGEPRRLYTVADQLSRVEGTLGDCSFTIGGGTDLPGALKEYLSRETDESVPQLIVVTDDDGAEQARGGDVLAQAPVEVLLMVYGENGIPRST